MSDVVVTVPKRFGLDRWVAEGDAAGEPWTGQYYNFYIGNRRPHIFPGERVYIVYNGVLRGYSPLVKVEVFFDGTVALVRAGDAVAVTIKELIRGFRGYRYRWWNRDREIYFPEWQDPNAKPWEIHK
jgi:hypothetical protein